MSSRALIRSVVDDGNHDVFYQVGSGDRAQLETYLNGGGDVNARVRRQCQPALVLCDRGSRMVGCCFDRTNTERRCYTAQQTPGMWAW